jgi:hypothetical protein
VPAFREPFHHFAGILSDAGKLGRIIQAQQKYAQMTILSSQDNCRTGRGLAPGVAAELMLPVEVKQSSKVWMHLWRLKKVHWKKSLSACFNQGSAFTRARSFN